MPSSNSRDALTIPELGRQITALTSLVKEAQEEHKKTYQHIYKIFNGNGEKGLVARVAENETANRVKWKIASAIMILLSGGLITVLAAILSK